MREFRAPGRVNLIGDHTDYNDGFVLPMAIDLECVVRASPHETVRVRSRDVDGEVDLPADGSAEPREVAGWGRYAAGVVRTLAQRGRSAVGIDASVSSTVPVGAGLSSSAALEVALALALCDLRPASSYRTSARTCVPGGRAGRDRRPLRDHGPAHIDRWARRLRAADRLSQPRRDVDRASARPRRPRRPLGRARAGSPTAPTPSAGVRARQRPRARCPVAPRRNTRAGRGRPASASRRLRKRARPRSRARARTAISARSVRSRREPSQPA